MQQIITARLKLLTTREQFEALRRTQLAYRNVLNAVSCYAFAQGKTSSVTRLHKGMSTELRARYGLSSQLACSVERQVSATCKRLWTRLKEECGASAGEDYSSLIKKLKSIYTPGIAAHALMYFMIALVAGPS